MSQQDVERFYARLDEDAGLRTALRAADLGGRDERLVEFAAAAGYTFTLEELRAFTPDGVELTDESLSKVAGGAGFGPRI